MRYRRSERQSCCTSHRVTFLERDASWHRSHRDLAKPSGWSVRLYQSLPETPRRFGELIRKVNLVIIGSCVPDGIAISVVRAAGLVAAGDPAFESPATMARIIRIPVAGDIRDQTLVPPFPAADFARYSISALGLDPYAPVHDLPQDFRNAQRPSLFCHQ
jgi:hypothetical protein